MKDLTEATVSMSPVLGHCENLYFFAMPPSPQDESTMCNYDGAGGAKPLQCHFLAFSTSKPARARTLSPEPKEKTRNKKIISRHLQSQVRSGPYYTDTEQKSDALTPTKPAANWISFPLHKHSGHTSGFLVTNPNSVLGLKANM